MSAATKPEATADIRVVRRYAELENERADLEDKLKAVKAKLDEMAEPVLAYFQRQGIDRTTIDGRTLYLRRDLYAGRAEGVTPEAACETLKAAGFGEFVKEGVVTQSLSAFLREREKNGEPAVPPSLAGMIVANEVYRVGSRRS